MSPRQEQLIEVMRNQPEDAGQNALLEKLFLQKMVEEGFDDVRAGRVISNQDALEKIRSWR